MEKFCLSSPNQSKLGVKPVSQGSDLSSRCSALEERQMGQEVLNVMRSRLWQK